MLKVQPIKRKSLVDRVAEQLRNLIHEGHLGPGDRLPTESELVKQMEVSRTVLREAISRLETMGLVTVRGSRGMFVGEVGSVLNCVQLVRSAVAISVRDLVQFTEFRRAIECDAARCAAERAKPEDVAELEALCEQIRDPKLPYEQAFRIDWRFHRKLLDLAGNEMMRNVMDVIREFVMASIVEAAPYQRDADVTYRHHRAIVEAVRAGDADAAERAIREHLNTVIRSLQNPACG